MKSGQTLAFTWRHKLLLSVVVPVVTLLALECGARVLRLPERLGGQQAKLELEMPAWMTLDDNAKAKVIRIAGNQDTIDWLSLFEFAPGFRVRLIPGIDREVTNTFSQIPYPSELKYRVHANTLGFRGPELATEKPTNTYRILIFGDSSSYGWGLNENERYGELLVQTLREHFPKRNFELGNFAIPGDSSEYGRLIFDRFAATYHPDLIIIGFGANDAKRTLRSHTDQVDRFRSQKSLQTIRFWFHASALVKSLELLIKPKEPAALSSEEPRQPAVSLARYQENLRSMLSASTKQIGVDSLLLTLCTPEDYARHAHSVASESKSLFINGQSNLEIELSSIIEERRYPEYLSQMESAYPEYLKKNKLFYITNDFCHPNRLGNKIISDKIVTLLETHLKKELAGQ